MDVVYRIERGTEVVDKTIAGCSNCLETSSNNINKLTCPLFDDKRIQKKELIDDGGVVFLCTNKNAKSNNRFREFFSVYVDALVSSSEELIIARRRDRDNFKLHLHNLINLNSLSVLRIYENFSEEVFMDSSRDEIIASIKSVIHNDDEKIAKLIIYLLKIETLKKSEILVYNKIFNKDKPDPFQFSIHKVVMLVMNIFLEDFKDKEVYVALGECYEVIYADFDVVAAALTHIFHNAQKYILPKSKMDISFQKVDGFLEVTFRMTSLRVKEDERIRIFEKDYSGVEATKLNRNGTGLGLWIVKELLKTMDGKIEFKSNVRPENKRTQLGVKYEVNEFKLSFTTAK